jgi:hypothetical protein
MDPDDLVFTRLSTIGTMDDPTIQTGADGYKADGDGFFDICFEFANGNLDRFDPGESVVYSVTGIAALTAASFDFACSGSDSGFHSAAHVQGIEPDGKNSGWVTAPEPSTLAVLAIGAAVLLRRRRP